jgi:hypothetical protein
MDHLQRLSDDELLSEMRNTNENIAEIARERRRLIELQAAVQAETIRRRQEKFEASYEERRKDAIERGLPPAQTIQKATTTSAAQSRLSGLSIKLPGGRSPEKPVGQAVKIEAPQAPAIPDITVSDHAVVRFMERVMGFDFQPIREQILTPRIREAIKAGMTRIRVPNGTVAVRDYVVTTYLPVHDGHHRGPVKVRNQLEPGISARTGNLLKEWAEFNEEDDDVA